VYIYGHWDGREQYTHVFGTCHWGVEVKILDACREEFGSWGGDNAVEQDLDRLDISSFGANIARVTHAVPANHDTNAARITIDCRFVRLDDYQIPKYIA
jgi:hypothetical protein